MLEYFSFLRSLRKMKWVTIQGNAMSFTPPNPAIYAKDITLRYPIFVPFDGDKIRITLDNFCCDEDVSITSVCIAKGRGISDEQGEVTYLTFNNNRQVTIKAHQSIKSDPINYSLKSDEYIIVNIYLQDYTNLTSGVFVSGPLSKGYYALKNQSEKNKLDINTSKSISIVYFLSNIDIYTSDHNYSIICYGDSITSGDWPDYLLLSLRENNIKNISIIRKAVSGTRILRQYDCLTYQSYGLKGKNRFIHEISSVSGAKDIIIQHGINDIIHPVGIDINIFRPLSDLPTLNDLIEGLNYYLNESKKLGLNTYLGTLLPINGWRTFNSSKEELKNQFNEYIISFPNHINFNQVLSDLKNQTFTFKEGFDSGDHLHPSKLAYQEMGKFVSRKIIK